MAENLQTPRPAEEGWTTVIRPRTGWFDIDLQELWRYRDLITMFVKRNFTVLYYPVLRVKLNALKNTVLRWAIKFAVFNAATVLVYLLLFALLGPAVLDELLADGTAMLAALLAAGNLSFWLCDRALAALTRYYHLVVKPKLKKKF